MQHMLRAVIPALAASLLYIGCASPPQPLPSPAPPPPAPQQGTGFDQPPVQRVERPADRTGPDPAFLVVISERRGDTREPAGEQAGRVASLLAQNHFTARIGKVPSDLPDSIREAAKKTAESAKGSPEDILIFGEVVPGAESRVILAAVDLRDGSLITDLSGTQDLVGFQGPASKLDGIVHQAVEELIHWVDARRLRARR